MLSLPQTVGHALLAVGCLASVRPGEWRLARDIARCTGIPLPYLSKILHGLGKADLVVAKRGYRGGFRLASPAEEMSLLTVAHAIDPRVGERRCLLGLAVCTDERGCPAHRYWVTERNRIESLLDSVSVASVAVFEWGPEHETFHEKSDGRPESEEELDEATHA